MLTKLLGVDVWRMAALLLVVSLMLPVPGCGTATPVRPGDYGQVVGRAEDRRIDPPPDPATRFVPLKDVPQEQAMAWAIERGLDEQSPFLAAAVDVVVGPPGVVTLRGTVDNVQLSRRAEEIAGAVWGVDLVRNELRVTPPLASAAEVRDNVRAALAAEPALAGRVPEVRVDQGLVVLRGWIDPPALRGRAFQIASDVAGVRKVVNEIRTAPAAAPPPTDAQIASQVQRRLVTVPGVEPGRISVAVQGGVVALNGFVSSFAIRRAVLAGVWTSGVTDVQAGLLRVVWRDSQVGPVKAPAAKIIAQRDGVESSGTGERPDDLQLAARISGALATDPYLDTRTILVRVEDGHVHLTGTVDAAFEVGRAAQVASGVKGVRGITNGLRFVDSQTPVTRP